MGSRNIARMCCATTLAAMALCAPVCAQPAADRFAEQMAAAGIAFDEWVAAGNIEQLDWKVQVQPARLGTDQRLRVIVGGTVNGREMSRRSPRRDFHLLMRVRRPGGEWFPSYSLVRKELPEPLPSRTDLEFTIHLYAAPGQYEMVLLLFDAVTGERNLLRRKLEVEPLKDDPLPHAYRNLPGIEFLGDNISEQISFSYGERGRLWLPVKTRQPVRVEVLVNLSRTEQYLAPLQTDFSAFFRRPRRRPGAVMQLSIVKALADLNVQNGSLHVGLLDLARRMLPFQQAEVRQLDWPGLVETVKKANEPVISTTALSGRQQNASFFRETLQQRLTAPVNGAARGDTQYGCSSGGEDPVRVVILVSEAILFAPGTEVKPLPASAGCNCRVFYLRYTSSAFDDLERMIKPVKPKRFDVTSPMELRRALRRIIEEIEKY